MLNILFINQPTSEYGQSLLYHGLHSLGHNVYPYYPNTFHYVHLKECDMDCENPQNPCKGNTGWGCLNHPAHLALTQPYYIAPGTILDMKWDLVVTNNGFGNERILRSLDRRGIPIACLDLGDSDQPAYPQWASVLGRAPELYFRREYKAGQPGFSLSYSWYAGNRAAHQLAFPVWDVSCLYRPTNSQRAGFAAAISEAFDNSVVGAKPHKEYLETIGASLFSVALPGAGQDTLRHWEIPAQGTVLCKPKSSIIVNNDFTGGENCIEFENVEDLISQVKYYLNSSHDVYNKLRENCYSHFLKYHTTVARASEFLNKCGL